MTERRHVFRRAMDRIARRFRRSFEVSGRAPGFPGSLQRIPRFASRHLDEPRDVLVYLPPGYEDDRERRYPVLYMHDGQNLFDPRTAFVGQHWEAGETAGTMIANGEVVPLIVVAIYNSGERRIDEYTPTTEAARQRGGDADRYGRMILEELKPTIDRAFRTLADPDHTAIAGSSLGGLVSLYLGLTHPHRFARLGVLSPSVWWDDRVILDTVGAFEGPRPRIWLDVGTAEGDEAVENVRRLAQALEAKGWELGQDLQVFEAEGAGHNEAAWAARFGDVLRFLFADHGRVERRTIPSRREEANDLVNAPTFKP